MVFFPSVFSVPFDLIDGELWFVRVREQLKWKNGNLNEMQVVVVATDRCVGKNKRRKKPKIIHETCSKRCRRQNDDGEWKKSEKTNTTEMRNSAGPTNSMAETLFNRNYGEQYHRKTNVRCDVSVRAREREKEQRDRRDFCICVHFIAILMAIYHRFWHSRWTHRSKQRRKMDLISALDEIDASRNRIF